MSRNEKEKNDWYFRGIFDNRYLEFAYASLFLLYATRGLRTFLFSVSFRRENFLHVLVRWQWLRPQNFPDFTIPIAILWALSLLETAPVGSRDCLREKSNGPRVWDTAVKVVFPNGFRASISLYPLHPRGRIIVLRRRTRCSTLYSITIHGKRESQQARTCALRDLNDVPTLWRIIKMSRYPSSRMHRHSWRLTSFEIIQLKKGIYL